MTVPLPPSGRPELGVPIFKILDNVPVIGRVSTIIVAPDFGLKYPPAPPRAIPPVILEALPVFVLVIKPVPASVIGLAISYPFKSNATVAELIETLGVFPSALAFASLSRPETIVVAPL